MGHTFESCQAYHFYENTIYIANILRYPPEIHYACMDQHVDATFETYYEAKAYAEYFEGHHNYQIIPFASF